ncbi:MAG: demethoxyubiquinone hydroxylase family protein [Pseudomonadota bacterium]
MRDTPPIPGESVASRRLEEMLRVDHAGEFGAVQIYRGQRAVFDRSARKSHAAHVVAEMEAGEQAHLRTFDRMMLERGVRPTLMAPIWRVAGFGLGAATALLGEKAAHACTEAVEEVIEQHYARQSEELAVTDPDFKTIVDRFREEEIGHKETAINQGAQEAPGYIVLSTLIKLGCRAAIAISEKV